MQEYIIGRNEAGQRLDKYLGKVLKDAPISFFYKMMRKKNIVLNGKKCTGKELLTAGDKVSFFLSDETFCKFSKSNRQSAKSATILYPYRLLDIVYEDDDMIFVNKPSGMLTQKAEPGDVSLNEYIIGYLLHSKAIDEAQLLTFKPSVCNRLDRNTSGLVLAGKSLRGTQLLSEMIKERTIQKYYITIVAGRLEHDSSIEGYLIKDEAHNKVQILNTTQKQDERYIRTDYHVLFGSKEYTVLEVHLITGRPHQIRAHLASLGHPVLGDYKYGNKAVNEKYKLKYQLLHAYRVVLPDGREFKAGLPERFTQFTGGMNII